MKSILLVCAAILFSTSLWASNAVPVSVIRKIEEAAHMAKPVTPTSALGKLTPAASVDGEPGEDFDDSDDPIWDADSLIWVQQGVRVVENGLSLAINGQGFFWVVDSVTGALKVTRDGRFTVDTNGNLVHWENGDQVLKYSRKGYSNIKITDSVTADTSQGNKVTHIERFDISDDGWIIGIYENGGRQKIAKPVVVNFANPRKLKRIGQHLFSATPESGLPSTTGKNAIFGRAMELLEEETYQKMGFAPRNVSGLDQP